MAQLEPLNLRITGNAAGLSAALGKAQSDVRGFSGVVGGLRGGFDAIKSLVIANPVSSAALAGVAALAAGLAAAAEGVRAVYAELNQVADAADVANKLALSFEELAGLRFSLAELSGLEEGAIDNALQRFQVGLAEAAENGSGAAFDAISRLGLNASELLNLGPVEAMKRLADATQALSNPTDQLLTAYELFGKQGAQLVTVLRGGRDALEESFNFGSRWLGLTEDQAQLAAAAADSWARIGVVIEGLARQVSVELAPAFLVITQQILGAEKGIIGLGEALRGVSDTLVFIVGQMQDLVELVIPFVNATPESIADAAAFDRGQTLLEQITRLRQEFLNASPGTPLDTEAELEKIEAAAEALKNAKEAPITAAGVKEALQAAAPATAQGLLRGSAIAELTEAQFRLNGRNADRDAERAQAERELIAVIEANKNAVDRLADAIEGQEEPTPIHL